MQTTSFASETIVVLQIFTLHWPVAIGACIKMSKVQLIVLQMLKKLNVLW